MGGHKQIVSVPEFNGEFCPFNIISNKLECFIVIHIIFSIVVIISTSICVITKISHSMARFRHDFVSYEGFRLWVPCKAHVSTPNEFWVVAIVWVILYASRERTAMTLIHVSAHFLEDSETCEVVLEGFSKSSILRTILKTLVFFNQGAWFKTPYHNEIEVGSKVESGRSLVKVDGRWPKRTAMGRSKLLIINFHFSFFEIKEIVWDMIPVESRTTWDWKLA